MRIYTVCYEMYLHASDAKCIYECNMHVVETRSKNNILKPIINNNKSKSFFKPNNFRYIYSSYI